MLVVLEELVVVEKFLVVGVVFFDIEEVIELVVLKKKKKKKEKEKVVKVGVGILGEFKCFYVGVLFGVRLKWF